MKATDSFFPPRPTSLAHDLLAKVIQPGDHVIDATAGNGHDTLFLAEKVGPTGKVWAFDVHPAAIHATNWRISEADLSDRVVVFHDSHAKIAEHVLQQTIAVAMFNLGYLPGEDHDLTTEASETLVALQVSAELLKSGGVLSVICYPGHEAGTLEAEAVTEWLERLTSNGWRVARYQAIGTLRPAPFLLMASKP